MRKEILAEALAEVLAKKNGLIYLSLPTDMSTGFIEAFVEKANQILPELSFFKSYTVPLEKLSLTSWAWRDEARKKLKKKK